MSGDEANNLDVNVRASLSLQADSIARQSRQQRPSKMQCTVEVVVYPWKQMRRMLDARQAAEIQMREHEVNDRVKAEPIEEQLPLGPCDENGNKHEDMTEEEAKMAFSRLGNPAAKIKKDSQFDYKFVTDRLRTVGLAGLPIVLDDTTLRFTFSRYYISNLYGGSFVSTFPAISEEKYSTHGINDFMMLPVNNHPHAPLNPGDPGLYFSPLSDYWHWPEIQRVFVMIRPGEWLHVGFYKMYPSEPLTALEWGKQERSVRKAWSEQILEMDWGVAIRVRVYWRQSHEGEPTEEEMEEMCSDRNFYQSIKSNLTWEDISNAYATGQEQLGVWCMKCVGYDTEFQRFLVENVRSYVPPSRKKKSNNREEERLGPQAKGKRQGQLGAKGPHPQSKQV
ncbi:hypothetical protein AcV5_003722 [Taiwanofungus camphoratus]|nr:hypothetical protein AcV5_003722 [Antrodia cinnamomea]